ncbi:hypothetical protein MTO96_010462 [Rhipicephalus appendiculatus]
MANVFLQPPAHFEPGDNPQQAWEDWKEAYNIYEQACEYATKPTATRRALLLHVLGPHGRRVAQTFPHSTSNHRLRAADGSSYAPPGTKQQHKHGDCHTGNLPELNPGQPVWLHLNQKWEKATVVNVGPEPRRYAVKTETGGILFRNRIHLRPRTPQPTVAEASPKDYEIAEPSLPVPTQQVEEQPRPPQTTHFGRRIKPPARYPSLRSDFT